MYKLVIVTAVGAGALFAQTVTNAQAPPPNGPKTVTAIRAGNFAEFGPIGITAALAGPGANIKGAPYSAQVETSRLQILADGNRIEHTTSGSVARDSQGRVRREESLPALDTKADAPHLTFIEDPVAGVHWTLDPRTKTAMKMPFGPLKTKVISSQPADVVKANTAGLPAPPPLPPPPPPPGAGNTFFYASTLPVKGEIGVFNMTSDGFDGQVSKTELGTQTIEGVPAQGTRTTRTIPAGKIGNTMPIVITTETWYSPDLKVLVMSKVNDPRMGETTYKLTGIQRADPPPSTFEVPPDYTIREGKHDIVYQIKKP